MQAEAGGAGGLRAGGAAGLCRRQSPGRRAAPGPGVPGPRVPCSIAATPGPARAGLSWALPLYFPHDFVAVWVSSLRGEGASGRREVLSDASADSHPGFNPVGNTQKGNKLEQLLTVLLENISVLFTPSRARRGVTPGVESGPAVPRGSRRVLPVPGWGFLQHGGLWRGTIPKVSDPDLSWFGFLG